MEGIKYYEEIDKFLKDLYGVGLDGSEWEEFINEMYSVTGINYEIISNNLEDGIKKGYSIEDQFKMIIKYYKNGLGYER